jgi:hypothetical protein
MDLNEFFGDMPQRPNHPDFWKLSEIMLRLDGAIQAGMSDQEKEEAWKAGIKEAGIDKQVITYAGMQRAMRPLNIHTRQDMLDPAKQGLLQILASVWIDGFVMGSIYNQQQRNPEEGS